MKYIPYVFVLFLLLVLQGGIFTQLGLGSLGNLLLLFTTVAVILSPTIESLTIALVAGLMLDLVSGSRDGSMILSFLAIFGFTYFFINKLVPREPNRLILFSCVAINTVIFSVSFVLINHLFSFLHLDHSVNWQFLLSRKLLVDLIVNIVLAYPIYLLYNLVEKIQTRLAKI